MVYPSRWTFSTFSRQQLGCFVSVAGVSGSGKSTLVFDVLTTLENGVHDGCEKITGVEAVNKIITVNQSPLNRMQRSNIATYTKVGFA